MGHVVISVDAELAWGYHDYPEFPDRLESARAGWKSAIKLFAEYDVPATWAIVGHLFLEACDGIHPDHPSSPDWFKSDPGGSAEDNELWYAPDLIDEIIDSDVPHEIGCHTFSHIELGDQTSREVADAEIQAFQRVAESAGLSPASMVFPRNRIGHRDVLADRSFSCYRGVQAPTMYSDRPFSPVLKLSRCLIGGWNPPIVEPTVDEHGLVRIPASLYLYCFEGPLRTAAKPVLENPIVAVAKRGIDSVCNDDGVFHMWLHPHDLLRRDGSKRLDAILACIDEKRDDTDLSVMTMREVARETLNRRPHSPVRNIQ